MRPGRRVPGSSKTYTTAAAGAAARCVAVSTAVVSLLLMGGCGGGEPANDDPGDATEIVNLTRTWSYGQATGLEDAADFAPHHWAGFGAIEHQHDFGAALFLPPGRGPQTLGEVSSGVTGTSYGVRIDSPNPLPDNNYSRVADVNYHQNQFYKKKADVAWVDIEVSEVKVEAVSGNRGTPQGCGAGGDEACWRALNGYVIYTLDAIRVRDGARIGTWSGWAGLHGYQGHWTMVGTEAHICSYDCARNWHVAAAHFAWHAADLVLEPDVDGDGGHHVILSLAAPAHIRVSLETVAKDEDFYLSSHLTAVAWNGLLGESGITVSAKDPIHSGGFSLVTQGVVPIPVPAVLPVVEAPPPVPPCAAPDPLAGQIELVPGPILADEDLPKTVRVRRTGGSRGRASVVLNTRDGTARAGADYVPRSVTLEFDDGQTDDWLVDLAIVNDTELESDETFDLVLSDVRGCATLGAVTTATVTILDDETRAQTYPVGGTVSGLAGSGLVLREMKGGSTVTPANGSFTFPVALRSGSDYDVRIDAQPTNPPQLCSVTHGAGTVAAAAVTDIVVACTTPAPNGSLDPSFGSGGMVATSIAFLAPSAAARMGMALQADGRILLVGGLKLARFNSDGTLDASFGSAGVATVPFNGSQFDYAQGVAVQADGRIVVVGTMSVGGTTPDKQEFALARFNADGSLDTSFGSAGRITTDFNGNQDVARRIIVLADGKLLVAGSSALVAPSIAETRFAVARYNADGSLDAVFASGSGRFTTGFGGAINAAQAITVQRDGKIVLAGNTAADAGAFARVGLVRLFGQPTLLDGMLYGPGAADKTFGIMGTGLVTSDLNLGGPEEAVDVVEQPGVAGQLRVASRSTLAGKTRFGLATFVSVTDPATGAVHDGIYPTLGIPTLVDFSGQSDAPRAMALQTDGKLLMVGMSDIFGTNPNMAIARYTAAAAIDTSFGSDGKVIVDFFGRIDGAEAVAVQADGKIVVGGFARNVSSSNFALVRMLP